MSKTKKTAEEEIREYLKDPEARAYIARRQAEIDLDVKTKTKKIILYYIAIILLLALLAGYSFAHISSKKTITLTNIRIERTNYNNQSSISGNYRYLTDQGVFVNEDDWALTKFNSADIHNQLSRASTCEVVVAGWRVQFLSWFENITEVKKCN